MSRDLVSVTIVTYNSGQFIRNCLRYVFEQDYPAIEVIVIDNASRDQTLDVLADFGGRLRLIKNNRNTGFAAGQNQAIALSSAPWVLTLNPDVRLTPAFVSEMVAAGSSHEKIGSVSGKLLAMNPDFDVPRSPVIDSTGIYFTPNLRHFDRGSKQPDDGRYENFEYVFGVTGAAALFRRTMIDDVRVNGEFFDSDFFAYREDADVAWRAQLLGWRCLYTPRALAYHVRNVLPVNRRSVPSAINMHSVKNRFLMRIKNITFDLYLRHMLAITVRDFLVVAGCLAGEYHSLRAFPLIAAALRRTLAKRREIFRRRRVSDRYIASWFSPNPVAFAAPQGGSRNSYGRAAQN